MNFCVTFRRKLVSRCHSSYIQYGAAVRTACFAEVQLLRCA